ncbi:MAG: hydantoinase B/oxoprolinase family protein [Pseudomonadota bacterium]
MHDGWDFWIDRGGTFTDVIARAPDGAVTTTKLLSDNPAHYDDAVGEGVRRLLPAGQRARSLRVGTTVATNALLTRRGARTALVVTEGFADLLLIGHQQRPELFALDIKKPAPLYERVIEATGRLSANGDEIEPLALDGVRAALITLRGEGIEAVAISLLHAYRNPAHEKAIGAIARDLGFADVRLSSDVSALIRYVERTATTLIDAYLSPVLNDYLGRLTVSLDALGAPPIAVMQSNGGLASVASVSGRTTILSGPAAGVVGMARAAGEIGLDRLIGFDMGGTSTDVCAFDGDLPLTYGATIAGIAIAEPQVAIETIAAGGGSVLHYTDGRLQAGPASAGADPGPAAYRNGGPLTVTDANLVLGRLPADALPAVFGANADQPLDKATAETAFRSLAEQIAAAEHTPATIETLAAGFLDVAVEHMANAIRRITLAQGRNPADYTLAVFGGAAAQHCCAVAERIGVTRIWLHPFAGVLSALGVGLAPRKRTRTQSLETTLDDCGESLTAIATNLLDEMRSEWPDDSPRPTVERVIVGLRYGRSNAVLEQPIADRATLAATFRRQYHEQFGQTPNDAIEVAWLRGELAERPADDVPEISRTPRSQDASQTHVFDGRQWCEVPMLAAADLSAGATVDGPAVIVDAHTTLWLAPGWRLASRAGGALLLEQTALRSANVGTERNPQLLEVFNGRFMAIAERMGKTLERTAQSVNIRERLDYSCAVFDAGGRLLANAPHMPVHLGSMGESVRVARERFGNAAREGDVWVLNSPYDGGTHLPDITVVAPWFAESSDAQFYLAARAHHADVGGTTPGSMPADSRHIDEEGVLIDCRQLLRRGASLADDLAAEWARHPYPPRNVAQNLADLNAQVAALREGARGLDETQREFGLDVLNRYAGYVHDNAAEAVRLLIRELGNGEATLPLDVGGHIRVRVAGGNDRLAVSFTDTSPQSSGNFNAPPAVCRAAVLYVFRCLVDRPIPLNDGCLEPIDLDIPSGSLLAPSYPAAVVAGNVETSQIVTDALLLAIGRAAASQGTMNNLTFGNDRHQYYETIAGGSGAGPGFDGADAVHTHMTNSRLTDPEVLEARFPVRVRRFGVRHGSGGAGEFHGGAGVVRTIEFLEAVEVSLLSGRRAHAPPGLAGGDAGMSGVNQIVRRDGSRETIPGVWRGPLAAGDVIEIATPGGGGFGRAR